MQLNCPVSPFGRNLSELPRYSLPGFDNAVWSVIYDVLLSPEIMIDALEREYMSDENEQTRAQITFLNKQIKELKIEDEKMYAAYLADAFDENEYAENRSILREQQQKLQVEVNRLESNLMSPEQFDERKQEIYLLCQNAAKSGLVFDAPFDVRQRIITTIVDKITLNANEGWFELEGVIRGQYLFPDVVNEETDQGNGSANGNDGTEEKVAFVCIPKGRDSSQQST